MFATSVDAHTSKRSHKHHKVKAKSKVVRTVKQPAVTFWAAPLKRDGNSIPDEFIVRETLHNSRSCVLGVRPF
jgi:hypothetical protein